MRLGVRPMWVEPDPDSGIRRFNGSTRPLLYLSWKASSRPKTLPFPLRAGWRGLARRRRGQSARGRAKGAEIEIEIEIGIEIEIEIEACSERHPPHWAPLKPCCRVLSAPQQHGCLPVFRIETPSRALSIPIPIATPTPTPILVRHMPFWDQQQETA